MELVIADGTARVLLHKFKELARSDTDAPGFMIA
jgi:hypothetical protein